MMSQERHFQNTTHSDYSSVRRSVEKKSNMFELEDDELSLSTDKDYHPDGNQNISSVLSQIRDEGPAKSVKPNNLYNLRTKNNPYADTQQAESDVRPIKRHDPLAELEKLTLEKVNNADQTDDQPVKISWIFFMVIAVVITAVVFYLVRLDIRTEQLEQSLMMQQQDIKSSLSTHVEGIAPDIIGINKTLMDVNNSIDKIQETEQVVPSTENDTVKTHEIDRIHLLEDEILLLKSELDIAKNKLDRQVIHNEVAAVEESSPGSTVIDGNWMVNLASFKELDRAQLVSEKLISSGFVPSVEHAVVGDSQIYRLIVSGFEEYSEAEVFVGLAADLYGLKGGWIRKVNKD